MRAAVLFNAPRAARPAPRAAAPPPRRAAAVPRRRPLPPMRAAAGDDPYEVRG